MSDLTSAFLLLKIGLKNFHHDFPAHFHCHRRRRFVINRSKSCRILSVIRLDIRSIIFIFPRLPFAQLKQCWGVRLVGSFWDYTLPYRDADNLRPSVFW